MKVANQFRRHTRSGERGVTMVLVAVAMVAIIGMAALSIDLVTLYLAREEAQRTADAAALAAARIISVSGITGNAAPSPTTAAYWRDVCGPKDGWATQAAQAAAAQNAVGGQSPTGNTVTITYSDGSTANNDCATLGAAFTVNPLVTVQVAPIKIPSFFSRIWGGTGNTVGASATAEVFNPSASNTGGIVTSTDVTPVQARCVKPLMVPNLDPDNGICSGSSCPTFVSLANGQITHAGISIDRSGTTGVIGEQFSLFADCGSGNGPCALIDPTPIANQHSGNFMGGSPPAGNNLEYLPGAVPTTSSAVPSCGGTSDFQKAVSGCDETTVYQCGLIVPVTGNPNMIDLSNDPGGPSGDTATGLACLATGSATLPLSGEDQLRTDPYPFVALAGSANLLGVSSNTPMTNSPSIVSLPIFDPPVTINGSGTTNVTIVGFLQVFVDGIDLTNGSIKVTVLNVAGCGKKIATNPPVFGSSPVPVRLIQPR